MRHNALRALTATAFAFLLANTTWATPSSWSWEFEHVDFDTFSYNSSTNQLTFTYPSGWTLQDVHLSIDGTRVQTVTPGTAFTYVDSAVASGHRVDIIADKMISGVPNPIITPIRSRFCSGIPVPYLSPHDTNCTDPYPTPNDTMSPTNDCDGEGQDGIDATVTCTGDTVTGGTDADGAYCQSETTVTSGGKTTTTIIKEREDCGTIEVVDPVEDMPEPP